MQTIRKTFPHTFTHSSTVVCTFRQVQPIERLEQHFTAFEKFDFYSFGDAKFGTDSNIGGSHMVQF